MFTIVIVNLFETKIMFKWTANTSPMPPYTLRTAHSNLNDIVILRNHY